MLPLKILPSWVNWCQVSRAILALGLLTAIVSGQQQRRVIGFDAEGRITIQVQYKSDIINRLILLSFFLAFLKEPKDCIASYLV